MNEKGPSTVARRQAGEAIPSQVTIHDVAQRAGVSTATVSRVLSASRRVRPEIATVVREAADALGYRPNALGRALRKQETETVALVVPDLMNPFFPNLMKAVELALRKKGKSLIVAESEDDPANEAAVLRSLLEQRVGALLISPCHWRLSTEAVEHAAARARVVQLDRRTAAATDTVTVDQSAVMQLLIDHLAATGRKSFALVAADPASSVARERMAAYRKLVRRVDPDGARRVLTGSFSVAWGREAADRLLDRRGPLPDALVCGDDLIAVGLLHQLLLRGVEIPRDAAIAGCDDTFLATAVLPELTSVRQPLVEMAESAVQLAFGAEGREGFAVARSIQLRPELCRRSST